MVFPWQLSLSLSKYLAKNKLKGKKRFPMVLMLEPTFRCNLACSGCGRIREFKDILDQALTVDECLSAVDESGAPVVSITGGEPLIHPDIEQIIDGIIARKKFIYLCTNGLLLKDSLKKFKPSPYLSFVLHMDSLAETHDQIAGREGVFDIAMDGMLAAKKAGFQVRTNTTIYKRTKHSEIQELFVSLSQIPVDGLMVSPAFSYEAVEGDDFLSRKEFIDIFQPIYEFRKNFRFYNTPTYLDFLAGKRVFKCTPWSTPTRNPKGWKKPCYLITDGHYQSFKELMEETSWDNYGVGNDPRCANCMVHCGFEATAIGEAGKSLSGIWQTIKWNFFGS